MTSTSAIRCLLAFCAFIPAPRSQGRPALARELLAHLPRPHSFQSLRLSNRSRRASFWIGGRQVLVENATRVARDLMVGEIVLAEFRKIGVKVVSADGGVDLTLGSDDPTGTLVRQILSAVSEWEKTLLVQKLRASRLRIRRSGRQCEGRKPFGQTAEERHTIQRVLTWKASGQSDAWIANQLNESQTPTRAGGQSRWHRMMVYRIVARAEKRENRSTVA